MKQHSKFLLNSLTFKFVKQSITQYFSSASILRQKQKAINHLLLNFNFYSSDFGIIPGIS